MILGIFQDLENLSDKLRKFMIENNDPITMLVIFVGLLLVFTVGWNALHKHD